MKPTRSIIDLSLRPSALRKWNYWCWSLCLVAVVAGAAFVIVAEQPSHASPDLPSLTHVFQPSTGALDAQVVAGKKYVFVADAGNVVVYEKQSRANPANLPFVLLEVKRLNLQTIFDPLYGPDNPKHPRPNNVNNTLGFGWPAKPPATVPVPIPCFIEDPWDWRFHSYGVNADGTPRINRQPFSTFESARDGTPATPSNLWRDANPANLSKSTDKPDYHTRYPPTSSCISEIYDVRIAYDDLRDVYYIGAAARNLIWPNNADHPENPDLNKHPAIAAQSRRFVFVAVSRVGADPTLESSYDAFTAGDENADWPLMGVRGDSVLVAHGGGNKIVDFYGPGVLAKGGVQVAWSGKWPLTLHHATAVLPVRNHAIPTGNQRPEIFFIGKSDSGTIKLAINAAVVGAPNHLVTAFLTHPFLPFTDLIDAVLSGGRLHVVAMEKGEIRYFSVAVSLTSDNKIVVGSSSSVISGFILDPTDHKTVNQDLPSVEVTKNGAVVVSYRAAGKRSTGEVVMQETRYSVMYPDDKWFRHYEVLKAGAPGSTLSTLNDIDFMRGWLDPDGRTVWIAGAFAEGDGSRAVVGAVTP